MNETSRRTFLGVGAAAAFLAACGDDDDAAETGATVATTTGGTGATTTSTSEAGSGEGGDDLATAAFAASLEQLAVNTYQAATSGGLGTVPPAVAELVGTALGHHRDALDAWNGVLTTAGQPTVTTPPAELDAMVQEQLSAVTDVAGAAQLALLLEQTAADTYLAAVPTLTAADAIGLAGSLQYVDQQHAAVLLFALGQYPVPEVFQSTDQAASPG